MPSDPEVRERRREVIREILKGDEPVVSQRHLVQLLEERGIQVTQASISRDLRDMGALRVKGRYSVESWIVPDDSEILKVESFIQTFGPASELVVLRTTPGTATFVARAIQATHWPEIVGVVAGDDAVFIAEATPYDRQSILRRLTRLFGDREPRGPVESFPVEPEVESWKFLKDLDD